MTWLRRHSPKLGYGLALALAVLVLMAEGHLPGLGLLPKAEAKGIGLSVLWLVDGLLGLSILFYLAAIFVPQQRLVLGQAVGYALFGLTMITGSLVFLAKALALLTMMLGMLFAIPFGTIAYFAMYHCTDAPTLATWWPETLSARIASDTCMAGDLSLGWLVVLARAAIYGLLVAISLRFLKLKGLVFLVAFGSGLTLLLVTLLLFASKLPFLLYPLDALLCAMMALCILIYGCVVFVKGMIAVGLAIAAQVG